MTDASVDRTGARLSGHLGLAAEMNANGSLRRLDCGSISLLLFVGNELEGGPANLYLRRLGDSPECMPLLGPHSPTCFELPAQNGRFAGTGSWSGVDYSLELMLSQSATAWFWHVQLNNSAASAQVFDLTYAQDLALAPYGAVRMNEFYVSQYIDHTPLAHPTQGVVVASRQNQAADGQHPWCIVGSLRKGASFATDALQFHGLANREGTIAERFAAELSNRRLQHEHSMVVIRDAPTRLERNGSVSLGFFGGYFADHPEATSHADLERVKRIIDLPEAKPASTTPKVRGKPEAATLFSPALLLDARDLTDDALRMTFAAPWRHEERDDRGTLLSFFHGADRHVALRAKELRVQRPHGDICSAQGVISHRTKRRSPPPLGWAACFIRWSRRVTSASTAFFRPCTATWGCSARTGNACSFSSRINGICFIRHRRLRCRRTRAAGFIVTMQERSACVPKPVANRRSWHSPWNLPLEHPRRA